MQIRIKSYTFHLSTPYQAGTVITKGEAQALNNLRVENIQNNLRKLVTDACAGLAQDELLSPQTLAEIQAKFTEYDSKYQFAEKIGLKARLGEIEEEAREVARERVEASFRHDGSALPAEDIVELMVIDQAELPNIKEEARMRVSARRRVFSEGLDSL